MLFREATKISFFIFCGSQISIYMKKKDTPSTHTHLTKIITAGNSLAQLCSHFPHNYYYTIKTQKTVVREVMVLYWSLWFLIWGSHSQGETFTIHPLLCDSLGQRNKNPLFNWASMNRKNRRRRDLAETSVPGPYSYTKTCGIINEKYTIIMTSDFWVIRELAPSSSPVTSPLFCGVSWGLAWEQNQCILYHSSISKGASYWWFKHSLSEVLIMWRGDII